MSCYLAATLKSLRQSILVIGYGDLLRSDDGIGPQIANEIKTWGMPNVQALAVHQLTPELAETLTDYDVAIFVDATPRSDDQEIRIDPITSSPSLFTMGHTSDPRSLLTLTQTLYHHVPQAWWVMVPGANFDVGDRLSALAERNLNTALEIIDQLMHRVRTESCMQPE